MQHLRDVPQVGEQPLAADLARIARLQLLRRATPPRTAPRRRGPRAPRPRSAAAARARRRSRRRARRAGRVQPDEAAQRHAGVPGSAGAAAPAPRAAAATPRPPAWRRRWSCRSARRAGTPAQPGRAARAAPGCCCAPAPRCRRAAPGAGAPPSRGRTVASPESSATTWAARSRRDGVPGRSGRRACRCLVSAQAVARRPPAAAPARRASTSRPCVLRPRPAAPGSARRRAPRRRRRRAMPSSSGASLRQLVGSVRTTDADARGLEVGVHVGAAEAVDRLLGVADEHQRAVPVERLAQDRPLHRVGVLELVDQHHAVARPQPRRGDRPDVGSVERVAQPDQHVVVVDELLRRLRRSTSRAHRGGDAGALPGHGRRVGRVGSSSVAGSRRRRRARAAGTSLARSCRPASGAGGAPLAQVEVVGHLGHQVADVLDQHARRCRGRRRCRARAAPAGRSRASW